MAYTDIGPRPGQVKGTGDNLALFLKQFGQMTLEAWKEVNDFEGAVFQQTIASGKTWQFPIIGRKRDAEEHTPGDQLTGSGIENNEVVISVDPTLVDSAFIAEIDQLMASYQLAGPYARQLGESLSTTFDKRAAISFVLASRVTDAPYTNGPVPSYAHDASMKTDPAVLEAAITSAVEYIRENDIGGGEVQGWLPWQQLLMMAKYSELDMRATSGSGNRAQGTIGPIMGINLNGSNHIPKTNITTGNTKYQGDFTTTVGFIANPMAVGLLNRRGMKVVYKEQDDRLGDLLIASRVCGFGTLRAECSFELATAVRS